MKRILLILAAATAMMTGCCGQNEKCKDECCAQKDGNCVIEAIMGRRSIRKYKADPVEKEKLQQIVECAINAPNAMNAQQWEVRVIDSPEYFKGLEAALGRNIFYNAPAVFVIASPEDPSGMAIQNVGLMSENICLAAYSLGLGTCIMGGPVGQLYSPAAKPFLDKLAFSDGYRIQILIACGYADEAPAAKPRDASKVQFVK